MAPSPQTWWNAAFSGGDLSVGKLPFHSQKYLGFHVETFWAFHHSMLFQCAILYTACLTGVGEHKTLALFEWFIKSQTKAHMCTFKLGTFSP